MHKLIIIDCIYFQKLIKAIQTVFIKNNIDAIVSRTMDPFSEDYYLILNLRDHNVLPLNYIIYNFDMNTPARLLVEIYFL